MKSKYILVFLLLLASFLRFHNIGERGLAGDEKYGLIVSQFVGQDGNNQLESLRKTNTPYFTPKEFWKEKNYRDFQWAIASRDNGSGAAYALTIHYVTKYFGISDTILRFPSLFFNLLTILLLYYFVKIHFKSERLALLTSFLATFSPFFILYSQVARNYSMLYFFSLLSTYLFLLIIKNEENNIRKNWIYLLYGISVLIAMMCHFSVFPLFLIHGLYVLLFVRKTKIWIGLILAMLIPAFGMVYWLNSDGGRWLTHSLNQSLKVYNMMANLHPNDELSPANIFNILRQLRHTFTSQFLLIDGFKTFYFSYKYLYLFGVFIFIISLLFYLKNIFKINNKNDKSIEIFIVLLSFLPLIFLILFAFQDKNTFRIMPRYVGYSYSFCLILISLIINQIYLNFNKYIRILFLTVFIIQVIIVVVYFTNRIYQDNPPNYFQSFIEPRLKNPYKTAADLLIKNYVKGDTVLYPSYIDNEMALGYNMSNYSVQDAQYLGFYLPKDSEMIQRINKNEPNKIILKKPDNKEILIFDFKGSKYRY